MKEIKAIIRPQVMESVLSAVREISGLTGTTVSHTRVADPERGSLEQVSMIRLEIMVPDIHAGIVVEAIQAAAHTGHSGDGRIFVIPIEQTVNIRTGEWGDAI